MSDIRGTISYRVQETLADFWPTPFPAGLAGDTQFFIAGYKNKSASIVTPQGLAITGQLAHSSAPGKIIVFHRLLTVDVPSGAFNFNFSAPTKGETVCASFDGIIDAVSLFAEINWSTPGAVFDSVTPPAINASANNSVLFTLAFNPEYPRNSTVGAPSILLTPDRVNPQEQPSIQAAKKVVDTGPTAPNAFTFIAPYGGDGSSESISVSIVIKPALSGGGGGVPPSSPPPSAPPTSGAPNPPVVVAAGPADQCVSGGYETIARGSALAENNQWDFDAWGLSGGAGGSYQVVCLGPQSSSGANSFRIQAYVPRNWPDPGGTVSEVKSYPAVYWGQVPGFKNYVRLKHPNLPIKAKDIRVCWAGNLGIDDSNMSAFGHLSHDMRLVDTDEDIAGYDNATPHIRVELFVVIKQYEGYGAHPGGRDPGRYMGLYNIAGRDWHFYLQPGASLNPDGGPNPQMIWLSNVWPLPNPLDMAPLFAWGRATRYQDLKQNSGTAIIEYGKTASDFLVDPERWFTHDAMGFEVVEGTIDIGVDSAYFRVNEDLGTVPPPAGPPPSGPPPSGGGGIGDLQAAGKNTSSGQIVGGLYPFIYAYPMEAIGQSSYIVLGIDHAQTANPVISNGAQGWNLIYSSNAAIDRPNRIFVWEKIATAITVDPEYVVFDFGVPDVNGIAASFLINGTRVGMGGNPTTQADYALIARPPTVSPPANGAFSVEIIGSGNYSRTLAPRFGGVQMMGDYLPTTAGGVSLAIGKQSVTQAVPQPVAWDPTDPQTPGAEAGDLWRMLTMLFSPIGGGSAPPSGSIDITIAGQAAFINAPESGAITAITQSTAAISWVDTSNDETGFSVRVRDTVTGIVSTFTVPANSVSAGITGLVPGRNYSVTIFAVRGNDISAPSQAIGFATQVGNDFSLSASSTSVALNQTTTITATTFPPAQGQPVAVAVSPANILAFDASFSGFTNSEGEALLDFTGIGVEGQAIVSVTIGGVLRTLTISSSAVVEGVVLRVNPARFEKDLATVAIVTGSIDGRSLIGRQVTLSSSNQGVIATPASVVVVPTTTGGGEARFVLIGLDNGTATITATIEGVDSNDVDVVVEQPQAPFEITASGVAMLALTAESPLAIASRPRVRRLTQADLQARFPDDRGMEAADITARTNYIFLTAAALLRK